MRVMEGGWSEVGAIVGGGQTGAVRGKVSVMSQVSSEAYTHFFIEYINFSGNDTMYPVTE